MVHSVPLNHHNATVMGKCLRLVTLKPVASATPCPVFKGVRRRSNNQEAYLTRRTPTGLHQIKADAALIALLFYQIRPRLPDESGTQTSVLRTLKLRWSAG